MRRVRVCVCVRGRRQILVLLRTCSILGECISPTILLMLMPSMAAEELLQDLNYLVALGSLEVMPPEKVPPHWLWLSYNVGVSRPLGLHPATISTPTKPGAVDCGLDGLLVDGMLTTCVVRTTSPVALAESIRFYLGSRRSAHRLKSSFQGCLNLS